MGKWINITRDLTPKGIENLKKGDILRFDQGGDMYELKIMANDGKKVMAKEVITYDPNDVEIVDKPN